MRFMILVKADDNTEAGVMPNETQLAAMGKFNEEMVDAGVMLAGEGLQPTAKGARIRFSGEDRTVVEGPFANDGQILAGFWMLNVDSKQAAIDWMMRCPKPTLDDSEIEIRQVFEAADFGEAFTPDLQEQEARIRTKAATRA